MVTVHVDPLMIAAPYMALSGLIGLLVGVLGGYWFGRRHHVSKQESDGLLNAKRAPLRQ